VVVKLEANAMALSVVAVMCFSEESDSDISHIVSVKEYLLCECCAVDYCVHILTSTSQNRLDSIRQSVLIHVVKCSVSSVVSLRRRGSVL